MTDLLRPPVLVRPVVPTGWHVKQSWTLLAPDGGSNVIVSCEPLSQHQDLHGYATTQGELLQREFPGFFQLGLTEMMTPQGPVPLRMFEWVPPDGVPVHQHQMYWVDDEVLQYPDGHAQKLGYTATGTCVVTRKWDFVDDWARVFAAMLLGHRAFALK